MQLPIPDRRAAGRALARALADYAGRDDVIVLALPRGGVPVAAEIAAALDVPLDVLLVRKLGLPDQPELAMGAIASGGTVVFNEDVLAATRLPEDVIADVIALERRELERRERAYRGDRPWPDLTGRTVILVDDGLATGATMRAAVSAVRRQGAGRVVVAVPVAPPDTVARLREVADEVIALHQPAHFMAVGQWYIDFSQVSDDEVIEALAAARPPAG